MPGCGMPGCNGTNHLCGHCRGALLQRKGVSMAATSSTASMSASMWEWWLQERGGTTAEVPKPPPPRPLCVSLGRVPVEVVRFVLLFFLPGDALCALRCASRGWRACRTSPVEEAHWRALCVTAGWAGRHDRANSADAPAEDSEAPWREYWVSRQRAVSLLQPAALHVLRTVPRVAAPKHEPARLCFSAPRAEAGPTVQVALRRRAADADAPPAAGAAELLEAHVEFEAVAAAAVAWMEGCTSWARAHCSSRTAAGTASGACTLQLALGSGSAEHMRRGEAAAEALLGLCVRLGGLTYEHIEKFELHPYRELWC